MTDRVRRVGDIVSMVESDKWSQAWVFGKYGW